MRALIPILLLAASLPAPANDFRLDETLIDTGFLVEQPLLFASLENHTRHVIVAGRDDNFKQQLAVFPIDDAPEASFRLSPGPSLIAYDVGRIGDRDQLFFIQPGRVMALDMSTGQIGEFVALRSIYGQQRSGRIVPLDFVRDINADGRDDLVVPDTAGYRVRLQASDGTLGPEVVLRDSSAMSVADDTVSFVSLPLVTGNMTDDELPDLAVWRGNALRIYPQLPGNEIQSIPDVIELGLGLQSEAQLRAREPGFGAVNQEGLVETRIWRIDDLNGDGRPDILTESLLNKGVFDKENDFHLHLGRLDGATISYREPEDALLASTGLQYGVVATDLDGDGRKDLLVRKVRMSFGRVIRALLSGNVSLQLHFYRMTDEDTFPEEANFVARTTVSFSVSSGQVDIPAIQVADFDGDGLQDLMMQTEGDELSFRFGIKDPTLFAEESVEQRFALPRNGDLVTAEDINGDGRADLVMRFNESDGGDAASTIRLLLSN